MKNNKMKMILITLASAVLGFITAYSGMFFRNRMIEFNSEFIMQGILYGSVVLYFIFILLFTITRKQLIKEKDILDEDEKETYLMNKVTNLIGYSSFMQLVGMLIFALSLIQYINTDGIMYLVIFIAAWGLLWASDLFIRTSFKQHNHYLPDLQYFYKKNESTTSYVNRLDEAQKLQVYKYSFSIVEKMKTLFLIAFAIAVLLTVLFDLSLHLLLGIMVLWCVFQFIIIRESKRVKI